MMMVTGGWNLDQNNGKHLNKPRTLSWCGNNGFILISRSCRYDYKRYRNTTATGRDDLIRQLKCAMRTGYIVVFQTLVSVIYT
jgi:hypothetical protein